MTLRVGTRLYALTPGSRGSASGTRQRIWIRISIAVSLFPFFITNFVLFIVHAPRHAHAPTGLQPSCRHSFSYRMHCEYMSIIYEVIYLHAVCKVSMHVHVFQRAAKQSESCVGPVRVTRRATSLSMVSATLTRYRHIGVPSYQVVKYEMQFCK